MIKWCGFDLDDTLFNGTHLAERARRASIHNMIKYGLPVGEDYAFKILEEIVSDFGSNYPAHLDVLFKRLQRDPIINLNSKIDKNQFIAAGVIGYHEEKLKHFNLFPDVLPALQTLKKRGIKLALITDGYPIKQYEKIIRLNLANYFDEVFISDEIGIRKPNPKLYQAILDKILASPEEMIYVGDRLDRDIVPANQTGIITALIHRRTKYDPFLNKNVIDAVPNYQINKLYDLLNIVAKLNNE